MSELAQALRAAVQRGLRPGKDLAEELEAVAATWPEPRDAEDAEVVCEALERIPVDRVLAVGEGVDLPLLTLSQFFQEAEREEPIRVFYRRGLSLLIDRLDQLDQRLQAQGAIGTLRAESTYQFGLKMLATYPTQDGLQRVLDAARDPQHARGFLWPVIFAIYAGSPEQPHPQQIELLRRLADDLPVSQAGDGYLEFANILAHRGVITRHPFDNPEGLERLQSYLSGSDRRRFGRARDAAASLAYLTSPQRQGLVALGMDHPDVAVQMESARAAAHWGSRAGLQVLIRYAEDPRTSYAACEYLEDLDHSESIPEPARDPDFQAMAVICRWLANPDEFGRPPDRVELVDTRELDWPPTRDRRPLWIVRFEFDSESHPVRDDHEAIGQDDDERTEPTPHEEQPTSPQGGIGLVGSIPFALFGETDPSMSPEDIYAIHCCWEMQVRDLPDAPARRTIEDGRRLLGFD